MSGLGVPQATLPLLPLALASGLDPYLTLFFLGAAALVGWSSGMPPSLADLGTLPAVAAAGAMYLLEAASCRTPWGSTVWNVANTPVRLAATGLLSLLLFQSIASLPSGGAALAATLAAALAGIVHIARTGWWLQLDLGGAPSNVRLLTLMVEDVVVLALLALALDRPGAGVALAVVTIVVGSWRVLGHLSAGVFAHALMVSWARGILSRGGWSDASTLPAGLGRAGMAAASPGGSARCTPACAWGPAVHGGFRRGWLVVGLGGATFLHRRWTRGRELPLTGIVASRVREEPFHTRVDLVLADRRPCGLAVTRHGPGVEALQQVFPPLREVREHSHDGRVTAGPSPPEATPRT